jgi:PHD/YefM family antitoxin component YafN of YafNO toxin-antitoxin module
MATTSNQSSNFVPDLEATVERAREANDRLAEVGRKVSSAYLDSVEKYFVGVAQFERKLSDQSQVEALASLLDSHAKLTEDVAKTSISATRELITA